MLCCDGLGMLPLYLGWYRSSVASCLVADLAKGCLPNAPPVPFSHLALQSLYPSQIIAYNLCFSTCLGRPSHAAAGTNDPSSGPLPKLGCTEFGLPAGTLVGGLAPECLVVAPNGVAFAPKEVRPGVLPRLLQEILNTRIMVGGPLLGGKPLCRVLDGQPVAQHHSDFLL